MNGRDLQKLVIAKARTRGWLVGHFPTIQGRNGIWRTPVAADGKGFPDLLLLRDRQLIVEIKGDGDRLRDEQETWLMAFRLAGVETYVWRTADWDSGAVNNILERRAA